jgi:hypothetical protein
MLPLVIHTSPFVYLCWQLSRAGDCTLTAEVRRAALALPCSTPACWWSRRTISVSDSHE